MKAIAHRRFGSPSEALELVDVEKPVPAADQVSIRIRAASLNPYDWHQIIGLPRFVRLVPRRPTVGSDVAGEVETAGSNVTEFKPGDAVFGWCKSGSLAEYGCTPAKTLARKPDNVSFEQAAALGIAGITALQSLRDGARVQPGQTVLINGAAGGVGTFAVQIAKMLGAVVTAVCSTPNVELVRGLGADRVVDYTKEDFTRGSERHDVVLDLVGTHPFSAYRRVLTPNGVIVAVGIGGTAGAAMGRWFVRFLIDLPRRPFASQRTKVFMAKGRAEDLAALGELVAAGKIAPVIARRYPLADAAAAVESLLAGHARGKVVVTV